MFLRKTLCTLSVFVMLLVCFTPLINADEEGDSDTEIDFPEISVTKKKLTTLLGDGEFIGIHNQDRDAMIGVLYGTPTNPNFIYIISVYTRYLGVADVYDTNGSLLKKGHAIPVRTIFAQQFKNILEFDDADNDGIFDSRKKADSLDPEELKEPVFKRASLFTAWTPTEVKKIDTGNTTKEWTFSLTAKNLKYRKPFGVMQVDRNNTLEEFTLTFHLYVDVEEKAKTNVPQFKVTVSEKGDGNYNIDSSEMMESKEYSGKGVDARFKYDHTIKGWDFSPKNGNRSLLLRTNLLFANAISDELAGWLKSDHENLYKKINANGKAVYEDSTGEKKEVMEDNAAGEKSEDEDSDGVITEGREKPRLIKKNKLHFQDNWQNVGNLSWVSDVTVDGAEKEMYFQVYGGRKFTKAIPGKGMMRGFWVLGGFSYPGGSEIFHDPQFNSRAVNIQVTKADKDTEDEGEDESKESSPLLTVLFIAVAVIIILVIIYLIIRAVRGREEEDECDEGPDEY